MVNGKTVSSNKTKAQEMASDLHQQFIKSYGQNQTKRKNIEKLFG